MEYADKWLSTGEAGRLLGISTATVYRLVKDGKLGGRKTSEKGHWRLKKATLEEYQRKQESSEQKGTME